jgi:hypothetical protein
MRFETPVYFQSVKQGEFDLASGNYETETVEETKKYASVTNSGTETMNLIYGSLKQGSLTVRIMGEYKEPFRYIRVGKKRYKVDFNRVLRSKHTFVISEVQE